MKYAFYLIFIFLFGGRSKEIKGLNSSYESRADVQTSPYELIKKAILEKKSMTFYYNGYLRKASPHVLGTKNGNEQALFMQYGGESESGLSDDLSRNWRCFFLYKIKNISINDDDFYTADNHSRNQSCVDLEEVVVDY